MTMADAPKPSFAPASSHDRILATAKRLFATRGYEQTSTAAIAREAGTSESQLIKHFGAKEGLLEAIFAQGWDNLRYVFRAVQEVPAPADKLQVLLELLVAGLHRDPELEELLLLEGRRIRKEGHLVMMSAGYLELVRCVDEVFQQLRDAGRLRPELDLQAVRSALLGMIEGLLRDRLLAERMGFPADYSLDELRRIFNVVLPSFLNARE